MQGVLPPEELPAFFQALESLGANPRKSIRIRRDLSREGCAKWTPERFAEVGIPILEPVKWYDHGYFFDLPAMRPHPSRHPAIAAGLVFIQEAGAMEVVSALEVGADHLVLDLCAAPGAKATQIGEYLGPGSETAGGWLVANEPGRDRAKLLDAILARHGIGNSTVYNLEPHRLAERFEGTFDRVLVDAPCSGESLFAKRNEKRKDVTHKEVARCALRQRAILEHGWRMLASAGRLVYSTCAYSRDENEDLVGGFLTVHPEAVLLREQRRFPHRDGVPGGYFAVLERGGEGCAARDVRRTRLREGIRQIGTHGLVRDGRLGWDGAVHPYARVMDRKRDGPGGDEVQIALDLSEAERFLAGDRPRVPSGEEASVFTWEGEPIAGVSAGTVHYPRFRLR
jgi:16S rRNA C967 or C1407 C5-methylase (RsmB/RsmF family)